VFWNLVADKFAILLTLIARRLLSSDLEGISSLFLLSVNFSAVSAMDAPKSGSKAWLFLAATRGGAAILVAVYHARYLLLQDATSLISIGTPQKAFYFLTSLGPTAVMIFFVLSGFLVGGRAWSAISENRWNWKEYAFARISRLYTVLIPAIAIGVTLDLLGSHFLGWTAPYSLPHYGSMLPESIRSDITPSIVGGNAMFLQEILVPTVGSNHALWSLTNEGWYYAIFPLLALLFARLDHFKKAIIGVCLVAIFAFLPLSISLLGLVWLMGAGVALLPRLRRAMWLVALSSAALLGFLMATSARVIEIPGGPYAGYVHAYVVGILVSLCLYGWLCLPDGAAPIVLAKAAGFTSKISYTLYLVHTPMMVVVAALIVRDGERLAPTFASCGLVLGLLALSIVYAFALWSVFERNTLTVRAAMSRGVVKQLHKSVRVLSGGTMRRR
jgi:peptidoglycan/LPS O-acetylase OafA/YrhL